MYFPLFVGVLCLSLLCYQLLCVHFSFAIILKRKRKLVALLLLSLRCIVTILREKSLAIYFEDSQFRRNRTFNFIVSKIYVDKRSRVR